MNPRACVTVGGPRVSGRCRCAGVMAIERDGRPAAALTGVDIDAAFEAARPRLVRVARSLVGEGAAEDAVHDTYLTARSRIRQLRDPGAVDAWLTRICVRRCFRLSRRGRRLGDLLARLPLPSTAPEPGAGIELRELVDRLPARDRTVLVLQQGYGYTLVEVAELVGISHANARQIASRTQARLLRLWLESAR